ncbi:YheC/YheD family protein [Paenibacillus sp. WC2504]|uniref:YheC/YheD family protein n=1 Tax=Paenibacillus sp. WC2504 TaxID=3461403 RepID=UPI004045F46B
MLSRKKAVTTFTRHVDKLRYMIQEAIPVATYEGRPYGIRVTVQHGRLGSWQVIGMIDRVAATGRHVTNVTKGGKVKKVEELFRASRFEPEQMASAIREASMQIIHI